MSLKLTKYRNSVEAAKCPNDAHSKVGFWAETQTCASRPRGQSLIEVNNESGPKMNKYRV